RWPGVGINPSQKVQADSEQLTSSYCLFYAALLCADGNWTRIQTPYSFAAVRRVRVGRQNPIAQKNSVPHPERIAWPNKIISAASTGCGAWPSLAWLLSIPCRTHSEPCVRPWKVRGAFWTRSTDRSRGPL